MSKISLEKLPGLGTFWWFDFYEEALPEPLTSELQHEISDFETKYSRFLPDSYISRLNRDRQLENPSIELQQLLTIGRQLYQKSSGYFNFLAGKTLEGRGYDASYSFTASDPDTRPANPLTDLNITEQLITLHGTGNIDLGGFGKGFLIDKLAGILQQRYGLHYFLINGGGDIYVTSDHGKDISLILEDPQQIGFEFATIKIQNMALCGSSPFKRQWKDSKTGKTYSHIINPKNLQEDIVTSAFTTASTTLMADVFSTVITLLNGNIRKITPVLAQERLEVVLIQNGKYVASPQFPKLYLPHIENSSA